MLLCVQKLIMTSQLLMLMECIAWKVSKYGVFSGPNTGKYEPEKALYLNTFDAVRSSYLFRSFPVYCRKYWRIFKSSRPEKNCPYGVFSGLHFPVFELNTEIYSVNFCIQSKCRQIQTRKNLVSGQFSCSAFL